jgi:hypothetical protein
MNTLVKNNREKAQNSRNFPSSVFGLSYSILCLLCLIVANTAFGYSGGTGTPDDPYQIADVNDLLELSADEPNYSKCFLLTADLNLADHTFNTAVIAPDKSNAEGFQGTVFNGVFEGAGHIIRNLKIETDNVFYSYIGLFGLIHNSNPDTHNEGEVNNLRIENIKIKAEEYLYYSGGLVGYNEYGYIHDCCTTGAINIDGGGAIQSIGGLIGYNISDYIIDCASSVDVNGGVNCYFIYSIGGLIGYHSRYMYGNIYNCSAFGTVRVFVRGNPNYYICTSLGGLIGLNYYGNIIDCFSWGNVIGDVADVCSGAYIGGLLGYNESGLISSCFSSSNIIGGEMQYSGGLVGYNSLGASITESFTSGHVSGLSEVGGFVGYNEGYINKCYSLGSVFDASVMGGFVGHNYRGDISNCYSRGDINAGNNSDKVGGLVGYNETYGLSAKIFHCYSTGNVSAGAGSTYVGGMVGYDYYGDINNSYFLDTSGPNNGYGVPLPDANMKERESFIGWDFVNETINGTEDIWTIKEDVNYPVLVWPIVNLKSSRFPLGWYEVDFCDFAVMGNWWGHNDCADINDCNRADFDLSGKMDLSDLKIFTNYWLSGTESY